MHGPGYGHGRILYAEEGRCRVMAEGMEREVLSETIYCSRQSCARRL
jgi:hypothetical protein